MRKGKPNLWDKLAEKTGMPRANAKLLAYRLVFGVENVAHHRNFWGILTKLTREDPTLLAPAFLKL